MDLEKSEEKLFRYKIILLNPEGNKQKTEMVDRLTFAEAATAAYMLKNSLGLDWKIHSVVHCASIIGGER